MVKSILLFGAIVAAFIVESSCQHIIRPTYKPPSRRPTIRITREANNDEPVWSFKGDGGPGAPASIIDDIRLDPERRYGRSVDSHSARRGGQSQRASSSRNTQATHPGYNRRNARSVDSPSARRHGGHSTSSGSRDAGPTHPGYNRRNTREIRIPKPYGPFRPSPTVPRPLDPFFPQSRRPYPIYVRAKRDTNMPGMPKPTVVIPNWNPNVRTSPWQRFGVKPRRSRSTEALDSQEEFFRSASVNMMDAEILDS